LRTVIFQCYVFTISFIKPPECLSNNHTGVPKRVSFSLDDVQITELASRKLVAKGSANHHAKAYEFSHFLEDANPIALLTHGNEVSSIWSERFGHLNFS